MKHIKTFGDLNEANSSGKKYTVTDKAVMKDIKKSVDKDGFSEFDDFLDGKITFEEFVDFVDGMGMSEVDDIASARAANRLSNAVYGLMEHLFKTNQITEEEKKSLESVWENIPIDDSE